jgi:hypothetical protein
MKTTNQGHKLREIWDIEDAVSTANQSASIARQYHQLTAQNVGAVGVEIDKLTYRLNHATDQISRLEGLINDSRNHCLMWGISGAIVSSLVMSMVTAPFNPPQKTVIQPTFNPVSEAIQPAPIVQKPIVVKPRSIVKSKTRRQG